MTRPEPMTNGQPDTPEDPSDGRRYIGKIRESEAELRGDFDYVRMLRPNLRLSTTNILAGLLEGGV